MSDSDRIRDAYEKGRSRPLLRAVGASGDYEQWSDRGPLILRPAQLLDPGSIPPRQWLYGTQLVRGFVTVLVAPGGTGKTAYAMLIAAALASGKELLGEHIFEPNLNVAVLNLEDPMDELNRRLAAIRIRFHLSEDALSNRYFMHSGEDRPITMAALDDQGFNVIYPDEDRLIEQIKEHQIGLVIVDPYAESHSLEENNNPQMVKAAAAWRRVARATNCAVLLVHHVRKGVVDGIDAARGAKALTDSARIGILLSAMSQDDANTLGVADEERSAYVRLDDAKANMAPKANKARWFKHCRINLGNGCGNYPKGDWVGTLEPWEPPSAFADVSNLDCNIALDLIDAGPGGGVRYTATKRGDSKRWAGKVLMDNFDKTEKQASIMIATWIKNGTLEEFKYTSPDNRHEVSGVRVNALRRPS